jgi:hypothetical protein
VCFRVTVHTLISFHRDDSPVRWAGQVALHPFMVRWQALKDLVTCQSHVGSKWHRMNFNPLLVPHSFHATAAILLNQQSTVGFYLVPGVTVYSH